MSEGADGPRTGPVGERAGRSGQPPVPRPLPAGPSTASHRPVPDDQVEHRTERVPFPLPPLAPPDGAQPEPGRETGQLDLGGYPPRVPGAGRPHPGAPDRPDAVDGGGRDGR